MKIKNLQITSPAALDFELDITAPVCVFCGEHSSLVLDLVRELIGDYASENDPDEVDDGRFVIHADVLVDEKDYSVCYIRNADFLGDHRIGANFVPDSFDFSADDTEEFLNKCYARNKDTDNVICDYKVCTVREDDRPIFVYCPEADDVSHVIEALSYLGRQVFIAAHGKTCGLSFKNAQSFCI